MKLIVGLGNPGEQYTRTRHNVGFVVVEKVVEKLEGVSWRLEKKFEAEVIQIGETLFVKPQTFMNRSGESVAKIVRLYKISDESVYVVHDDLDIILGEYKLQLGKGPRLHYGVESVEQELGSKKFWRARVGVENSDVKGNSGIPGEQYSLQNFAPYEQETLTKVIEQVVAKLVGVIS